MLFWWSKTNRRRGTRAGLKECFPGKSMTKFRCVISRSFAVSFLMLAGALAQAANVTGTVTNKTTGKPSAGDSVVLVDVQAGMNEAATAKTDSKGQYSLTIPPGGNMGAYLIRVTHQGASYFIAAPQSGAGGDLTVYDVAAKVDGVGIDADMLLLEGSAGELRVSERYLVRNASNPPKAQFSDKTFEIALPPDAMLDSASATRPGGLGTTTRLTPLPQKGHYTFNTPIQPDQGQKQTLFEVQYHISYSGKYQFRPQVQMPADNFVVYVPKSMNFANPSGADFQTVQDDPRVTTNIAKSVRPGQQIAFTVSGEGQMPRNQQQPGMSPQGMMAGGGAQPDTSTPSSTPGGGIGNPIGTPDPLTKYKWWILGGLTLLLVMAAIYLLRGRGGSVEESVIPHSVPSSEPESRPLPVPRSIAPVTEYAPPPRRAPEPVSTTPYYGSAANSTPAGGKAGLLAILKEELFAIESERLSGTLSQEEYADIKTGLEAVLKRALKKPS
jgi:5-hydroxyisourate hydrolase-like protein (transthyretin family)